MSGKTSDLYYHIHAIQLTVQIPTCTCQRGQYGIRKNLIFPVNADVQARAHVSQPSPQRAVGLLRSTNRERAGTHAAYSSSALFAIYILWTATGCIFDYCIAGFCRLLSETIGIRIADDGLPGRIFYSKDIYALLRR
jgi:hypothetical protein